jgi:ribonuclease HII
VILPRSLASLAKAGLTDSKQLAREDRERLDTKIRRMALSVSIAEIDAQTIDRVNIYQATRMAMLLAVQGLSPEPDHLLIDAMHIDHPCPQTKLFYGDSLSLSIAAASVIAKVHRDGLLRQLDRLYPQYGLASHKGYATPEHRKALREHGPCALHRRTFAPVRNADPDAALEFQLESGELLFDDSVLGGTDANPSPQEAAWV